MKIKKSVALATAIAAPLFLASAPATAATTKVGVYGTWSEPTFDDATHTYSGEITFTKAHVTHATYTVTFDESIADVNLAYTETTNDKGDWITTKSDMGKAFGANGPSDSKNLLITEVALGEVSANYTVEIIFDDEVDAADFALAAIDLDADSAVVEMFDSSDNPLSGDDIKGSASEMGFNICDPEASGNAQPSNCDGETYAALNSVHANDVEWTWDENSEDEGVAAWVRPSAGVKRISAAVTGLDDGSSLRWAIAVLGDKKKSAAKSELASTGTNPLLPGAGLLAALAGGIAVAAARRSVKN